MMKKRFCLPIDQLLHFVGATLEEVIGEATKEFLDANNNEISQRITGEILEKNQPIHNYDLRLRSKDGKFRDVILSSIPITYMGKKAVMVSYRDITERKKVQKELKESEKRYRLLIEHLPLGILLHQNQIIQFANRAAIRLLGAKNPNDVIGLNIFSIIHPDYRLIASKRDESIERESLLQQSTKSLFGLMDRNWTWK